LPDRGADALVCAFAAGIGQRRQVAGVRGRHCQDRDALVAVAARDRPDPASADRRPDGRGTGSARAPRHSRSPRDARPARCRCRRDHVIDSEGNAVMEITQLESCRNYPNAFRQPWR
jgi:hypothetical protein